MKLSVIMPVYNEESALREILEKVLGTPFRPEVVVVDDGSTDGTPRILSDYDSHARVRVVTHETNQGKGTAIRSGLGHVTGDVVIVQDADLEYDPADYASMIGPFSDPEVQVVYGSRRLLRSNPMCSLMFFLGGLSLTWLTNLLYRTGITDEPTCYKAFRTELLKSLPLRCRRFEFCPEVTALVARRGIRIVEVPIHYSPRGRQQGKKIGFRDWYEAAYTLIKYRLLPAHAIQ